MPMTNANTQENSNISWRNLATIASLRLMVFRSGKFQNSEPASWFHADALGFSASTVWYHCTSLVGARHTVLPLATEGPLNYPPSPKAFTT
jgi:hypothetical protein